jgi:hypothetical protein
VNATVAVDQIRAIPAAPSALRYSSALFFHAAHPVSVSVFPLLHI